MCWEILQDIYAMNLLLKLSYIISPPPIIASTIGFSIIGQQVQSVVQYTLKNKELCNPFLNPYLNPQLEVQSRYGNWTK